MCDRSDVPVKQEENKTTFTAADQETRSTNGNQDESTRSKQQWSEENNPTKKRRTNHSTANETKYNAGPVHHDYFLVNKKYYAVAYGRKPGIYNSWKEAKAQVHGFRHAIYKSFVVYDDAFLWFCEERDELDGNTV